MHVPGVKDTTAEFNVMFESQFNVSRSQILKGDFNWNPIIGYIG